MLFNIFINDIFLFAKTSTLCNYAVNNTQFSREETFDQVVKNLQTDFRTHTLKAFHHFKNKQQKCMKLSFLTCKSINILKVVYTLRIKQAVQKMLSFFSRAPAHHSFTFNLRFLYELKPKVRLSKPVHGIFHFRFRPVSIKVYIFVQQNA